VIVAGAHAAADYIASTFPGNYKERRRTMPVRLLFIVVVLLAGCGDPETNDHRGYTKAPLERPAVLIRGEEPSAMRAFGRPRLPESEPLVLPDSAGN
jgi:hypothetical protein